MFHLEKHRHQLIIEIKLSDDAMKAYTERKKAEPKETFILKTVEDVALGPLVSEKKSFKATIEKRGSPEKYVSFNLRYPWLISLTNCLKLC